jgi:hypothetical protein
MKPMPFNRRAFLKSAVVNNAAAVNAGAPRAVQSATDSLLSGTGATQSRLTPEERALIRAAVEQRLATGERSPL